jgi:hypothetical protein
LSKERTNIVYVTVQNPNPELAAKVSPLQSFHDEDAKAKECSTER